MPEGPSGLSAPAFGVLPAEFRVPEDTDPASGGARDAGPRSTAGEPGFAQRRARAAWLVPIALLALGIGVVVTLYVAGRRSGVWSSPTGSVPAVGGSRETDLAAAGAPGGGGAAAGTAGGSDTGRPTPPADGSTGKLAAASQAPDAGAAVSAAAGAPVAAAPAEAGSPAAVSAPSSEVPGPAVSSAAGEPDATAAAPDGTGVPPTLDAALAAPGSSRDAVAAAPQAVAGSDAGRRVGAGTDRPSPPARDAGVLRDGPATLVVPQPEGLTAELAVFVDGVRRGVAPLRVELPAGEHELRFEAAGRQSLSIVRLRPGERRTFVPRQIVRQFTSP